MMNVWWWWKQLERSGSRSSKTCVFFCLLCGHVIWVVMTLTATTIIISVEMCNTITNIFMAFSILMGKGIISFLEGR